MCRNSRENGGGYYFKIKVSFADSPADSLKKTKLSREFLSIVYFRHELSNLFFFSEIAAVYFCFSRSFDGCKNTTTICHFKLTSLSFSQKNSLLQLVFFCEINDQPLEPNDVFFPSFSFFSQSKTRIMSAERVEKRTTQARQCCDYALYEATLPR